MKDIKQYGPIIAILVGVVLLIMSYLYGMQAYNKKSDEVKEEIKVLEQEYNKLKVMYDNKAEYEKLKAEYEEKYEDIIAKYDAGITAESVIMDVVGIENEAEVFAKTMGMQENEVIYTFGAMTSKNPDNPQPTGINTGYAGILKEYTIVSEGTYENTKEALKVIVDNSKRKVITGAAFKNDESNGIITLTLKVNEYAITGEDREASEVIIPPVEHSVESIFGNDGAQSGEGA